MSNDIKIEGSETPTGRIDKDHRNFDFIKDVHATTFSIEFVQVLATHRFARIGLVKFDQSCSTPNCSFIDVVSCNKNFE